LAITSSLPSDLVLVWLLLRETMNVLSLLRIVLAFHTLADFNRVATITHRAAELFSIANRPLFHACKTVVLMFSVLSMNTHTRTISNSNASSFVLCRFTGGYSGIPIKQGRMLINDRKKQCYGNSLNSALTEHNHSGCTQEPGQVHRHKTNHTHKTIRQTLSRDY
jgi:hypothetical protein